MKKWLVLSLISIGMALLSLLGLWVINKYWHEPVMAIPENEVGQFATLETQLGDIVIKLSGNRLAVANFTRLARSGFYDNIHVHRIVPDLLIETGDPLTKDLSLRQFWGQGASSAVFPNSTRPWDRFTPGTVAMTSNNTHTYSSQFFISTADTAWLSGQHTIIGQVITGLDLVTQIESEPLDSLSAPVDPILIRKISIK